MKTVLAAIVILILLGLAGWFWLRAEPIAPIPAGTSGQPTATTTAAAIPGDNLALGQDANASSGGRYLIGYDGMALYAHAGDKDGSGCTGQCATVWPPYIVTRADNLVAESPLAGTVSTVQRADGALQLTYDGTPLYFYSGDALSGDTLGAGVSAAWSLARP
jgi:predicted lipoprotein with Yx(FWY)xxD motif